LQKLGVLSLLKRAGAQNFEQPVKERVLPWEVRRTTRRFEDAPLHVNPIEVAMKVLRHERTEVRVVPAFRTRALLDSILAVRCMSPITLSQRLSKPYRDALFETLLDVRRASDGLRKVTSVVQQSGRNAFGRCQRKSPGTPCEGKDATGIRHRQTSKPFLHGPGYLLYVTDLALRKANVTEGYAQVLQLVRHPISTSRAGSGNPLPDYPATTLLRKTAGHETCPHCLPDSSVRIDTTPMGLLTPTLLRRGGVRGTYYTAKK
jgi:hypothetical protein